MQLITETPPNPANAVEHHCYIDHRAAATRHLHALSLEEMDADWMLGEFFGSIYVINLPQATDRLEKFQKALLQIGVRKFHIFPAIDGRKDIEECLWKKMVHNWARFDLSTEEGRQAFDRQRQAETGCYLSHLGVIKKVKVRFQQAQHDLAHLQIYGGSSKDLEDTLQRLKENSSVLILEDDNSFGIVGADKRSASLAGIGRVFRHAMQELPLHWDMLYFMAMSKKPTETLSPNLVKLSRAILMNAYAVNHTLYDAIIRHLEKIYDPSILSVAPVDGEIGDLHAQHRCYAITPSIAYQREGTSSIIGIARETYRQTQPEYD